MSYLKYEDLSDVAKNHAYNTWLDVVAITWGEDDIGDTSKEFFEREYANEVLYDENGDFIIP